MSSFLFISYATCKILFIKKAKPRNNCGALDICVVVVLYFMNTPTARYVRTDRGIPCIINIPAATDMQID